MLKKLLIADDLKTNRMILDGMLHTEYVILQAANGQEALNILAAEQDAVSAVLLDIGMPVMDGYETLQAIRSDARLSRMPVIMITGNEDEEARIKAISLGANDYVMKPYISEVIKHCLKSNIALSESEAALELLQRDRLTGLLSRESFFQRAAKEIEQMPAGWFILSCVDIDNFKVINDQYGSETGDRVLKSLADTLLSSSRKKGGLCGRIFADCFVSLYDKELASSGEIGPELLAAIIFEQTGIKIALSVGRYVVEDKSLSVSAMYDRASIAQRTVKGRYDVHVAVYSDSMRSHIVYEQSIVNDMNTALRERQFEVWFQPQYNHSTGAQIGAEALVRWRHPKNGLISPGEFIPVFERNGFIYTLDKFIWQETCRFLRKWIDEGDKPLPVSVNISRCDIFSPDIVDAIVSLVEEYSLPIELLRLEITESAFSESSQHIVEVVRELIGLGFTVEIDDFGSGYSSLNTLKDVPAQILKLDMRFLEGGADSSRGGNIIESVVRMAKWLGMSVIAEGVETQEQADYLLSIGCVYLQGFLYAAPMDAEKYEAHCRDGRKEERLLALETVENLDNNSFWDPASIDALIFNSFVGGACIFEYYRGHAELLRATRKYIELIGSTEMGIEDILKLDLSLFLSEEDRINLKDSLEYSIASKSEVTGEYVFSNLPGCPQDTYLRAGMRVIATAGERYLVYCTNENITAQRLAEKRELEASAQIRRMTDDMPGGFCRMRVEKDGTIKPVHFNAGFCRLIGMSEAELWAMYAEDATAGVHPEDRAIVSEAIAQMFEKGEARSARYRLISGNGGYIWLTIFGRVTMDASGETFLNIYYTDASEQVSQEETERTLLDNLPGGAGLYRYAGGQITIAYLNKSYWSLVGRSVSDPSLIDPLSVVHPDDIPVINRELLSAIEQGRDMQCDMRLLHEAEGYKPMHLVGHIVPDKNGGYSIFTTFSPLSEGTLCYQQMLPLLLSAMMEATSDLSFAKDSDFRYVSASRAFARLAGKNSADEIIGRTDYELFERELADKFRKDDESLIKSGAPIIDMLESIPSADGTPHYSLTSKYLLKDGSGKVAGLYGVGRDVTKSVAQDSQLRLVNDSIPGGLATYICTPGEFSAENIRLTYFNDGFCKLMGYSREEYQRLAAADPVGMIFSEDRHLLAAQWTAMMQSDVPTDCLYRVHIKGGGCKWISHKAVAAGRKGGKVVINAILQDVTEQRELIERLRISEEENNIAVRLAGNIVCHYLISESSLSISPEVAAAYSIPLRITGIPYDQVDQGLISRESADAYISFFESIKQGSKASSAVFQQKYFESWKWLEAKSSTVFSHDGKPVKAVISFLDVTERLEKETIYKKWQQSLEDRQPESYTLYRCNLNNDSSFAYDNGSLISFDFESAGSSFNERAREYIRQCVFPDDREKYTAFANADIMLADYYREKRSDILEYREIMPDGVFRWLRLTADLVECPNSKEVEAYLMYEDIDEAKREELQTKELSEHDSLTGLLNRAAFSADVCKLLASACEQRKSALLILDIDDFKQVNDVFGHGAGDQVLIDIAFGLRSILRPVDLAARLGGDEFMVFLSDIPGDSVAAAKAAQICSLMRKAFSMEVRISGSIGIAMAPRDGLSFEALYKKADSALYYVKGYSKDGHAFYNDSMEDEHLLPEPDMPGAAEHKTPEKKRRMLIVDDSDIDHEMMQNIFREEFLIEKAHDGATALIRLRHYGSAISVVLLDLVMPGMDGYAVLESMREDPELRDMPVIIVSSDESREACLTAIRKGATDFITKPVDPELLRIRVHSAVSRSEIERLHSKNALLEAQYAEQLRYEAALEDSGVTFIEYDLRTHSFTYYPSVSLCLMGSYDDRPLWRILLSDMMADTYTVQDMQQLLHRVAEDKELTCAGRTVKLKTPTGAVHSFSMTVRKLTDENRLAVRLIIVLVDLDHIACGGA